MNTTQKLTAVVGMAGVFLLFCLAPWEITERRTGSIPDSYTELAPLWDAPSVDRGSARLRSEVLAFELLGIACAVFVLAVTFRSKPRGPGEAIAEPSPRAAATTIASGTEAPKLAANHAEATIAPTVTPSPESPWRRRLHSRLGRFMVSWVAFTPICLAVALWGPQQPRGAEAEVLATQKRERIESHRIQVNYKDLATLEYPGDWSDDQVLEHVRANEPAIRKRIQDALTAQGEQETAEDAEAPKQRIQFNPLVQAGEALEKWSHSETLDAIPGSREGFWTGRVPAAMGVAFASTLFGWIVTVLVKPGRRGTIACLLGTTVFFVLNHIETWMS